MMGYDEIIEWRSLTKEEQNVCLLRPVFFNADEIKNRVESIIGQVKNAGDAALNEIVARFGEDVSSYKVPLEAIKKAKEAISEDVKSAVNLASKNIEAFHNAQKLPNISVETMKGVMCQQVVRPIQSVGLYIPGGTAPLLSTTLMLVIPAKIAGCKKIVLCSPPPINDAILYIADIFGIDEVYQVGGAQAVAAMAFGTESIPKVDKIFGPGNSYVTEAKQQVSQMNGGAAIDMPAGPSEVLIIADDSANPTFTAADLLSQAEHGTDSQVVLLTTSRSFAEKVKTEVDQQLSVLSRKEIASACLAHSRIIICESIEESIAVSNAYGPEHLILQFEGAENYIDQINSAGSIFVGNWTPESVGDYASGTNHVLPTNGYTATYSSLGLLDFMKRMTVQMLTKEGIRALGPAVECLALAETLDGHKNAVTVRLNALKEE